MLPLLVGTLDGPPRFQLVAAGVASVLTVVGFILSPPGDAGLRDHDRAMSLVVIWTTAIVLWAVPPHLARATEPHG